MGELDTADKARLHGMVAFAAADAAIGCWDDKFYWNFWRPIATIREADTDGNPATVADPNWRPLFDPATPTVPPLGTSPFPDHPSGHSCLSGAVLNTAEDFFGTDRLEFEIFSSRFPGQPRHFERSRTRSRRSSTLASGVESNSAPQTNRERRWESRSPATSGRTTSNRCVEPSRVR